MRTTGATEEQINAAKDWTEDYLNVLVSTGRAIAAEAVRLTVPPTHRVASPDVVKAIWSVVDRLFDDEDVRIVRDWLEPVRKETTA